MTQISEDDERMCGFWRGEQIAPHAWLGHRRREHDFETVELWVIEPEASHATIVELSRAAQDVGQLPDGRYVAILAHQAGAAPGHNPIVASAQSHLVATQVSPRLRAPEHLLNYQPANRMATTAEQGQVAGGDFLEDEIDSPHGLSSRIRRALNSDEPRSQRRRRIVLAVAGACVAIFAVFAFVPRTGAVAQSEPTAAPSATFENSEPSNPRTPEDSAILIAAGGTEPAVAAALGDISQATLSAVRLSETGEFVLIRVDAVHPDATKTSATLLLQNGETGWQMRNVMAPASAG